MPAVAHCVLLVRWCVDAWVEVFLGGVVVLFV
jgi:hypothetical protein